MNSSKNDDKIVNYREVSSSINDQVYDSWSVGITTLYGVVSSRNIGNLKRFDIRF